MFRLKMSGEFDFLGIQLAGEWRSTGNCLTENEIEMHQLYNSEIYA